jgi:hypothetical protein
MNLLELLKMQERPELIAYNQFLISCEIGYRCNGTPTAGFREKDLELQRLGRSRDFNSHGIRLL